MDSNHITVIYKWTAQPGRLDELTSIYAEVTDATVFDSLETAT